MLAVASKRARCPLVCGSAVEAARYLRSPQYDLVVLHLLLSCVAAPTILPVVRRLLSSSGFCTLATTTLQSFPGLRERAPFLSGATLSNFASNPATRAALLEQCEQAKLAIHQSASRTFRLAFGSAQQLMAFGLYSGWLTQFVEAFPQEATDLAEGLPYPFCDEITIEHLVLRGANE